MEIILSRQAHKTLDKLGFKTRERIINGLSGLNHIPQEGDIKPLRGIQGVFRLRIGDWRILFENLSEEVYILKIAPRGDVYK